MWILLSKSPIEELPQHHLLPTCIVSISHTWYPLSSASHHKHQLTGVYDPKLWGQSAAFNSSLANMAIFHFPEICLLLDQMRNTVSYSLRLNKLSYI